MGKEVLSTLAGRGHRWKQDHRALVPRAGASNRHLQNHPCVKVEVFVAQSCPTLETPWAVVCQAPLSMGFSRPEYWSGSPVPSPAGGGSEGVFPTQELNLGLAHCRQILYLVSHQGSPKQVWGSRTAPSYDLSHLEKPRTNILVLGWVLFSLFAPQRCGRKDAQMLMRTGRRRTWEGSPGHMAESGFEVQRRSSGPSSAPNTV